MAEIETDKATMDYESFNAGTVLYLGAKEGEPVQINGVLAIVGNKGEDYSTLLAGANSAAVSGGAKAEQPKQEVKTESSAPSAVIDTSGIKAEIALMPKMSDTMTEGVIAVWHKKVGDQVKTGELLAEIETDKATMDYESYSTGTLLYVGANAKEAVKINGVLAIVGEKGADWQTLLKAHEQKNSAVATAASTSPKAVSAPSANTSNGT
jgi:pyruvate dehydrogenase E2 component (dihydrolipoamide acetyltransferase)